MRLADLHPHLVGTLALGSLRFDCLCGKGHKVIVPLGAPNLDVNEDGHFWTATGELPDTLSLSPSIHSTLPDRDDPEKRVTHWHGTVTNGEVTGA